MRTGTVLSVGAKEIFVITFSTYAGIVVTSSGAKWTNTVFAIKLIDWLENALLVTHAKSTSMLSFCTSAKTVATSCLSTNILKLVWGFWLKLYINLVQNSKRFLFWSTTSCFTCSMLLGTFSAFAFSILHASLFFAVCTALTEKTSLNEKNSTTITQNKV